MSVEMQDRLRDRLIAQEWAMLQTRLRQDLERILHAQDSLVQELLTRTSAGVATVAGEENAEMSCGEQDPHTSALYMQTLNTDYAAEMSYSIECSTDTYQQTRDSDQLSDSGAETPSSAPTSGALTALDEIPGTLQQVDELNKLMKRNTGNTFCSQSKGLLCAGCGNICMEYVKFCRNCGKKQRPPKFQKTQSLVKDCDESSALAGGSGGPSGVKALYETMAENDDTEADAAASDLTTRLRRRLFKGLDWWNRLEEPMRQGPLLNIVQSWGFQTATMFMVLSNCIFILLVKNHTMDNLGKDAPPEFFTVEVIYSVFFAVELSFRLALHKQWFFINQESGWNNLDLFIVLLSIWGVISTLVGTQMVQFSFLRSLRTLRLARILRLLKMIKVFNDLRVMVYALINSMLALFWCCLMLAFINMLFALVFVQMVEDYMQEHFAEPCLGDPCLNDDLLYAFGSVQKGMLSLYMATSGGNDWSFYYNMLAQTGEMTAVLFIFYTAFYFFGTLNILTGLFVDKAMQAAQPDAEIAAVEQRFSEPEFIDAFGKILEEFDQNNTGTLDDKEYVNLVLSEKGRMCLNLLNLEPSHTEVLYRELKAINRDGEVPLDEFVKGCTRMRGLPCNMDVRTMQFEISLLREEQRELMMLLSRLPGQMKPMMNRTGPCNRPSSKRSSSASSSAAPPRHAHVGGPIPMMMLLPAASGQSAESQKKPAAAALQAAAAGSGAPVNLSMHSL